MKRQLLTRICISMFIYSLIVTVGVMAQWSNDPTKNTSVSCTSAQEWNPSTISDGSDGAIVVWKYYSCRIGVIQNTNISYIMNGGL